MTRFGLSLVGFLFMFFSLDLDAQTSIRLGQVHTYASTQEQAYWLTRNDFGLLRDDGINLLNYAYLSHSIIKGKQLELESGATLAWNTMRSTQAWLPMAWVKASAFGLELQAGRFDMSWENPVDPQLSSGDLRFGRSSVPMPMIRIQSPNWIKPIPFFDTFQVKGMMLHGWLENARTVKNAFVHAKSAQFSLDLDGFRPRFGISHMVQWAGRRQDGAQLPASFDDFLRIFRGQSGDQNAPVDEQINVLGNHLGTWDMGFDWENESFIGSFVWHHLFEDGSGQRMRNGSDGMLRVSFQRKGAKEERPFVKEFVFEHLNTTNASGWGPRDGPDLSTFFDEFGFRYGGRDPYYTHYIYQNGWTYLNQPMHHPFFMTTSEGLRWAPEGQQVQGGDAQRLVSTESFVSTSILAHHVGWSGYLPEWIPGGWQYRQRTSIVRYYGNMDVLPLYFAPYRADESVVSSDYAFYPDIVQYFTRVDFIRDWTWADRAVQTTFSLAMDRGEWHRTFGFGFAVEVSL